MEHPAGPLEPGEDPIDHLFRRESGRMIATVARLLGLQNLALAEDVVQDAFCRAVEVWKYRGMPPNPEAWLMATAKNRALDVLRRERTARKFAPELASEWSLAQTVEESFTPHAIKDDQLRMMFSCCDPRLKEEAQLALVLHLLCGFGIDEIAAAFLVSHHAMEKRVIRAKKSLAELGLIFDLADAEFSARLSTVYRALYLLFNEGYHGASSVSVVRAELCQEALRLTYLLMENPLGAAPATFALGALMCFHGARLRTRIGPCGELAPLVEQDRTQWDSSLIEQGKRLLANSASGYVLTEYHLEAMIASLHMEARSVEETNWRAIVELYDVLVEMRPSPVVALNRAIAVAQLRGPAEGIEEIRAISERERLDRYPFYWAAIGELESRRGDFPEAREAFLKARDLARNPMERHFLSKRIADYSAV
ncbi:RNA polymerase sigma factor [Fimbriimonas ginsengisoli]|uniref:Putative RNA polymerase, sigma-24 subunit, ECF subfamily n=1 Tax=Fimbriimonas ginsengisoli Gsoil 348 TaxID=661478 RepID=A0A068NQ19_FIMGI|nr:sigma-70 family RNA polymerase sigma factor [Fimbriimonas ginsengisoli]AIE83694.1 putative RNA polymerase, sigma-24 subunit, ECF subfamily [Fimbriimonas ginsengisoli Gsoil 348]